MSTILRFSKIPLRNLRSYKTRLFLLQQRNVVVQNLSIRDEQTPKKMQNLNKLNQIKSTEHVLNPGSIRPLELNLANLQKKVYNYELIDSNEFRALIIQFKESGYMPSTYILFLIHCCGNFMCHVNIDERIQIIDELWTTTQQIGKPIFPIRLK